MLNNLAVGLGEIKISRNPQDVLVAYGLGSCVGIGMYDPQARVAGLLHAILPVHPNGSTEWSPKYVDSGVQELLEKLAKVGAMPGRLVVRLAGGANMLVAPGFSQVLNIGSRNIEAAQAVLAAANLKIAGQDVGGHAGRTVRLYVADGRMTARLVGSQERDL
jgi:chemotaxis protein CheD